MKTYAILFYKPQETTLPEYMQFKNNDFALAIMNDAQCELLKKFGSDCICIDSTRGLNSYGFELVTLLIIDDVRQGFPCAFFISNRTDAESISVFLSAVKQRTGTLKPNVFMSDMAQSFFNAWMDVMEEVPEKRLYCTWHVDRAWRENLKKVKGKEKQIITYKTLRTLLEERDEDAFNQMLLEFLHSMGADENTTEFVNYFQKCYLQDSKSWAYCYRLHCGINTNMHLENMHKSIKYIYIYICMEKTLNDCTNLSKQL